MLPESTWQQPEDLAELALLLAELGKLKDASQAYDKCIKKILDSSNPSVLFVLPQRLSVEDIARLQNNFDEAKLAKASAQDIFDFFSELKKLSLDHARDKAWKAGDLVQISWDDRLWSGRVVALKGKKLKVHFIGFPSSQDDWLSLQDIREHPAYDSDYMF